MKFYLFYILFWMFSGGVYLRGSAANLLETTFSNAHTECASQQEPVRLQEIDIANPVLVLR